MTDKELTKLTRAFISKLVAHEVPHIVCVTKANKESYDVACAAETVDMLAMLATIVANCSKNYGIPKKALLTAVAKVLKKEKKDEFCISTT